MKKITLGGIIFILHFCSLSGFKSPIGIDTIISESASVKLTMIDVYYHSFGMVWEGNAAKSTLLNNLMRLNLKYGKESQDVGGLLDPGFGDMLLLLTHDPYIGIKLPDTWIEIYHFENNGTLPTTKFKSGTIKLKLIDGIMVASFTDNTECMVGNNIYFYSEKEKRWLGKEL
jgi:hypothetical protein